MEAILWVNVHSHDAGADANDAVHESFRERESFWLLQTSRHDSGFTGVAMSADLEALSRLMAEVRPRLHRYCARMVGSVFDGEDIVQEALAKATEALPSAGPVEKVESWLFTIAHNTALDALRRRRRQA